MKQVILTRKHKTALTSELRDASDKILKELEEGGLAESTRNGYRLTATGQAKARELKLALAGHGPQEES